MLVPLVDVRAAHAEIAMEVERGFARVLATGVYIGGYDVERFEQEYAAFARLPYCVGLANGTDALEFALRAAGVRAGRAVILPANSFVATAEAVCRIGARPVLVDCDPATYLIDVPAVLGAVTADTAAIVPVHLYGQLAPVQELVAAGVPVVEDAAQCHGATRHGLPAGSARAGVTGIAATSFYPGKNLGAYGDAGAVVTGDGRLAETVRMLANHGGLTRHEHDIVGWNSRLDALQAVVLRVKLRRLATWNTARRTAAARYDTLLAPLDVVRPAVLDGNEHVWHLYVIRVPADRLRRRRDRVLARLKEAGIGAGIHYPAPIHRTGAFAGLGYGPDAFPCAEEASAELLSLPLYPQITTDQQELVVRALADALRVC